jgi:polyisoprenoid-binding protein YceI
MAITTWQFDPAHSEIQFRVRHLMITNVTGSFDKFSAELETNDENFESAKISFSAETDSVTTKNEQRDEHLKSPDFFDVAKFPALSFASTKFIRISDKEYTLTGNLTIHGVTKSIELHVIHGGIIMAHGHTRTGFNVEGKINRKDFGLVWHSITETGGLVLGDDVNIYANVQFIKPS